MQDPSRACGIRVQPLAAGSAQVPRAAAQCGAGAAGRQHSSQSAGLIRRLRRFRLETPTAPATQLFSAADAAVALASAAPGAAAAAATSAAGKAGHIKTRLAAAIMLAQCLEISDSRSTTHRNEATTEGRLAPLSVGNVVHEGRPGARGLPRLTREPHVWPRIGTCGSSVCNQRQQ